MEQSPTNMEQLLTQIDGLSLARQNEEALELIKLLPENEEKYFRLAYIGANYVESGNLEKAEEIVEKLNANDEGSPYAGGVLELIMRSRGEID